MTFSDPGLPSSALPSKYTSPPSAQIHRDDLPAVFLMTNNFDTGGSERQFVTLASALDRQSFDVHLGCIRRAGPFLTGFEATPEFPLRGNLYGIGSWKARHHLGNHLKANRIAIAHAFDFYTNLMLLPAARMARVPILLGSQRQLGDLLSPAKERMQRMVFRLCDRLICNSSAAAERLVGQGYPRERVVVIGNGLPLSAFAPTAPAFEKKAGVLRVGMVARMNTTSKNHELFVRAAARVASRFPQAEFVLVGDGPLRKALQQQAQSLGLGAQAIFLGDRRDIPALLRSFDVTVLPSDSESLSNAILESMAAGVPVIASDVGGNPELLRDRRGLLIAPMAEEAWADAIATLLSDADQRSALAAKSQAYASANFTIETMRRRHEDLYSELLEKKHWLPAKTFGSPLPSLPSPTKTRVAIVAASLRYVGGQSVQADLLIKNWRNDPAVEARLIPIDPPFPRGLRWAERLPGVRTLIREPLYVWQLWKGFRDIDIAHIFSASFWSFLIAPVPAWAVARLRGKRVLIHYHSGEARNHLRRFRSARPVLARVDRLVVPSGYLVDVFHEFGLSAHPVANIIDLAQFSYRKRDPLRPHLVCTRGFHPYYAVDVVVRAFAEVVRSYPEAQLDLVGHGPEEAKIRALVQELQLSGVRFTGVASREQIGAFYNAADIFVNASLLDNMPVSVLEAFASGTPVVSTAPEGMRHLVEDGRTGLLSEPGDAMALANNVLRVLREPELAARLAENAHQQSKLYEWTAVREQWLEVYRALRSTPQPWNRSHK